MKTKVADNFFESNPQDLDFLAKALNETAIIAKTDLEGRITFVNDYFLQVSGYSREEVLGQNHNVVGSGKHDDKFFKGMWEQITSGQLWRGEICNRTKEGSIYWVDSLIYPSYNQDGDMSGYVAIRRDITHKKLAQEQLEYDLKKSLVFTKVLEVAVMEKTFPRRLKKLLEIITGLPWLPVKTEAGIFLVENGSLVLREHINLGIGVQEKCAKVAFGQCLCGRVAESKKLVYTSCLDELHETVYDGMKPHGHYNFPILDGDELLGVVVLYLEEGHKSDEKEVEVLNLLSKITGSLIKSWMLECELEESKVAAMNANKFAALGQMAGGLSHELNNPLAIINLSSNMLLKKAKKHKVSDDELVEGLKKIVTTVDRMAEIISSIKQITRMEKKTQNDSIQLDFLIEESLNLCSNFLDKEDIDLRVSISEGLPKVNVNPVEMSQVLINIYKNSYDAVAKQKNKKISIDCMKRGNKVVIEISDNGPGISKDVINHVMEPFYTTKPVGEGTGLGLSISKNLCERNRAKLYIDEEREDTTFIVEFSAS